MNRHPKSTVAAPLPAAQLCFELFAIAVIASGFFTWLSVRDHFVGNLADGSVYLAQADAFSPWRDGNITLGFHLLRDFAFPPLYPLLLALGGGGGEAPQWSYTLSSILQGAAVAAIYAWLRVAGCTTPIAITITVAYAIAPATLLGALNIQSEPLYNALVFAGFALCAWPKGSRRGAALGALLIGLSMLARSVGISAIVAVSLRAMFVTDRRWLMAGLAVLPALLWAISRQVLDADASYFNALPYATPTAAFSETWAQVETNSSAIAYASSRVFDLQGALYVRVSVGFCALLAALAWLARIRRMEVDAIYVALHVAILLVWPYPNHMQRFLQVLLPVFLFYAVEGADLLAHQLPGRRLRVLKALPIIVLTLITLPSSLYIVGGIARAESSTLAGFLRSPQWYSSKSPSDAITALSRNQEIFTEMREIDNHLPKDACVLSAFESFVPLYSHRRALPLPGASATAATFEAGLDRCTYIFMVAAAQWPRTAYPPMYPYNRIKDRLDVIDVRWWNSALSRGSVLTMLAKIRPAGTAPTVPQIP